MTSARWTQLSIVGIVVWVGGFIANLATASAFIGALLPVMIAGLSFQFVMLLGARRARYRKPTDFSRRG